MKIHHHLAALAALTALTTLTIAPAAQAQPQSQGVSKDTITLGTIQDLSGPLAGFGKQARQGMLLRVDEVNEQGGVHGRRLELKVEDSGYDPKRALLAAQKLVNQDRIFLMAGHIGTAQNLAAMPVQFSKNVINFLPLTAAREMYEPLDRLKYAFTATCYDQIRLSGPKLIREKNAKKSAPFIRTTSLAWRCCAAAKPHSKRWEWSSRKKPRSNAEPPIFPHRSRA